MLRAAELTGLSNLQKPQKPPRYATGPSLASEICSGSTFFHLWKVVQIFQRESMFCSKLSSGGNQFLGSIFTMTPHPLRACEQGYQSSSGDENFITGLTTAEIDKAVQLARRHAPPPVLAATPPSSNQIEVAIPPALPPRPPPPPPRSRSWREYVLMSVIIGGVGYAVVQFVRVSCSHIECLTMNPYLSSFLPLLSFSSDTFFPGLKDLKHNSRN